MISVIMQWTSATFLLVPCPVVTRVIKDVITHKVRRVRVNSSDMGDND
jgi:hypothetical protein